jgi:hypothetical protein
MPRFQSCMRRGGSIPPLVLAINEGVQKYKQIPLQLLAIFACPHNVDFDPALRGDPMAKPAVVAVDAAVMERYRCLCRRCADGAPVSRMQTILCFPRMRQMWCGR